MTADDTRTLKLPYADVAYRESGSGEPILFVHSWPVCSTTWRKVIPALQPSYRCLALDLMGIGYTTCDLNRDIGIQAQARMLTDFLDGLEIERVTLVAHDSGATIARAFAIDHPQRVARLVLFDTEVAGHMLPSAVRFLILLARMPASDRLFGPLLRSRRFRRSRLLGLGNVAHDHDAIDLDDFFATALGPTLRSRDSLRASLKFIGGFDMSYVETLAQHYDRLTMPKLVIWSERDYFFPPRFGPRSVRPSPSAQALRGHPRLWRLSPRGAPRRLARPCSALPSGGRRLAGRRPSGLAVPLSRPEASAYEISQAPLLDRTIPLAYIRSER